MRISLSLLLLLTACLLKAQTLEQTAGIYYAYPGPQSALSAVPDGYEPFYITHYGRHGSRWITDDYRYTKVLDEFADDNNLTPLGKDVKNRLQRVTNDAMGRSGSLSPIGERQHKGIASRMIANYPEIFTDSANILAVSSTSLRCAMSMAAFLETLKEVNPTLDITRTAHQRDMDYIAHTSPAGRVFSADSAAWRQEYWNFVGEMVKPDRLISTLFVNPDALTEKQKLDIATGLYWIASDMQDVEVNENFYDIFTYDELRNMWRCINARMYICNANSPIAESIMVHCADNLLSDFISKADAAVHNETVKANLRFGHDTHLLRLLALIGITTAEETDMAKIHEVWKDYELSPMAANLQMIFFKNSERNIIVKILLNENEVTLPIESAISPYYEWNTLRAYLSSRLN